MAGAIHPHFQNDAGHAAIDIGVKEFMCVGANPPFDHPHVFLDMGADEEGLPLLLDALPPRPVAEGERDPPGKLPLPRPRGADHGKSGRLMAEARSRQIVIAGAGIAGLTAALAFAVRGYPVRVFERARAARRSRRRPPVVAQRHAASSTASACLPGLRHTAVRPDAVVLRDASSLAELGRVQLGAAAEWRWKAPYLTAHRADLQSAPSGARRPRARHPAGDRGDRSRRDACIRLASRFRSRSPAASTRRRACCSSAPTASGRTRAGWSAARTKSRFSGQVAWRRTGPRRKPSRQFARRRSASAALVTAFLTPGFHLITYPVRAGAALNLAAFTRGNAMAETWSGKMDTKVLKSGMRRAAPALQKLADDAGEWTVWPIHTARNGPWTASSAGSP